MAGMAGRGPAAEPAGSWGSPVDLPYSDAYLGRLAAEHRRLERFAAVVAERLDEHERLLYAGLVERNLTRLDVDGLVIRRVGRGRIEVL